MPNSKTLLQTILAAFCAILCTHLSALGGGGMMIGVRTGCWAKEGARPWLRSGSYNASQLTGVKVGVPTDFSVGAKIREYIGVDYTISAAKKTLFSKFGNYGYMMNVIDQALEQLSSGDHVVEWTAQSDTTAYNIMIDGVQSIGKYTSWWGLQSKEYDFYIGNATSGYDGFYGKVYKLELYDSDGVLRHQFIPDASGVFIDSITGLSTVKSGSWTYGEG